jgi:hypothetical protein
MRLAVVLALFNLIVRAQTLPNPSPNDSYSVIYTGRMLGYFRMPELQTDKIAGCTSPPEPGSAAQHFKDLLGETERSAVGTTIRVASGDNFSPYVLSRDVLRAVKNDPTTKEFRTKDVIPSDQRDTPEYAEYVNGRGKISVDNVACFVSAMAFDALVPGQHDFYFGPEYLRKLAELLGTLPNGPRILASNLVLHTQRTDKNRPGGVANEPDPKRPVGDDFGPDGPSVALPKMVLPWMRAVRIKTALQMDLVDVSGSSPAARAGSIAALRQSQFPDAERTSFGDWLQHLPTVPGHLATDQKGKSYLFRPRLDRACIVDTAPDGTPDCSESTKQLRIPLWPSADNAIGSDIEYQMDPKARLLEPGQDYWVCMVLAGSASWSCTPFTVQQTFFEYPKSADQIKKEMPPWVLKPGNGGLSVAIFGVVDPGLMQSVGRLNYTWVGAKKSKGFPDDDSYETVVQAAQAGEALKQVLGYCLQQPDCRVAHKVLLAQMSEQDAYGIVGQMQALKGLPPQDSRFELIVAAADPDRASGDRTIVRTKPPQSVDRDFSQPVVLVPGEHVPTSDPYSLQVRLQEATVTPKLPPAILERSSVGEKRVIRNAVFVEPGSPFSVDPFPETSYKVSESAQSNTFLGWIRTSRPKLIEDTGLSSTQTDDKAARSLELLALKVMRDSCNADAAVLQHRDVFFTHQFFNVSVDKTWLRLLIEAIFWKGDYIQCIDVTGDTLKSMLDRSKQLQDEEDNGLATSFSRGWALANVGLDADAKDPAKRLIRGAFIDPKKLYSVAITDYLANGDTGYPMLQNAQPAPADLWSQTQLRSIARAIEEQILDGKFKTTDRATEILDSALHNPVPPAKPTVGLKAWASNLFKDPAGEVYRNSVLEGKTQQRPRWIVDLYKADASFALFKHTGTEPQLGQIFPGVTVVDLSSPNTQTVAFDYMFRIQHTTGTGAFYLEDDLNYGHKANRTPTNVYQRSDTGDYWNHELGYAWQRWPHRQNPASFKLLAPVDLRTQVWPPITQITPDADAKGAKAVASQAPINYTVSLRPGVRFDYTFPKPDSLTAAGPPPGGAKGQPGQIQTGQSWSSFFEAGFEAGRMFNGPSSFVFTPSPGAQSVTCTVYDTSCIATMAMASGPTTPNYAINVLGGRDHNQKGFYADFRFDFPLPLLPSVEFVAENRGDFYVFGSPGDAPVDARLYDDVKASLNFPILRKITLSPTFEWIVFRNKAGDAYARAMGGAANTYYAINTFVSLTYSFDWHSGLEWKKVLGFANQAPPVSALPVR